MPTGTGPTPKDSAAQLADLFLKLSMAIDQFRDTTPGLSTDQVLSLGTVARQLDELSGQFNAAAIGDILQRIQPSLNKIFEATKDAQHAVKTIKSIEHVVAIATAGLALATAIMSGNLDTIGSAVGGLASAVRDAVKGDTGKSGDGTGSGSTSDASTGGGSTDSGVHGGKGSGGKGRAGKKKR